MIDVDELTRVRVVSPLYSLSVTAQVPLVAFERHDPDDAARAAACELFAVSYMGPGWNDPCPTFHVDVTGCPKDPELVLRTVAARLETWYDTALGEPLLR